MKIEILNQKTLKGITSASGIIKLKDRFYVVGDDSPFQYVLDEDFEIISNIKIHSTNENPGTRMEKSTKPDFEAMEMIDDNEIIIFGSGSKSPERDIVKHLFLKDPENIKSYQISEFYDVLRNLEILKGSYLNIEAVAYRNREIFLFNRGKNIIFCFVYQDLISYFEGLEAMPFPKIASYKLPDIKGLEAGFSGATTLKDQPYIIFTASVEDTPNAYDDGEIMGSLIGMIHIEASGLSKSYQWVEFPEINGKLKVESVTIREEVQLGETIIVVVTDDDLKESLIIDCRILW